jgi:hypothetical protein
VKCFLGIIMIRHCLLCFAAAQTFALSVRESGISAFPDNAHYITFSPTVRGVAA